MTPIFVVSSFSPKERHPQKGCLSFIYPYSENRYVGGGQPTGFTEEAAKLLKRIYERYIMGSRQATDNH